MKIEVEDTKWHHYAFVSPYSQEVVTFCRYLKESLGWKNFQWSEGKWRFTDPEIAKKIKSRFPDTELPIELFEREQVENTVLALKQMVKNNEVPDLEVKNIKSDAGEILPYQKVGVKFFIDCKGRALLSDDMGLGKSLQALAYIAHEEIKKTLVVCPASVKYSWESEIQKWTHLKSFVMNGLTKVEDIPSDTNIIIINYDVLHKFYKFLIPYKFEVLILDECHFIKSQRARRTKVTKLIAKYIPKAILLSGTPILSRPAEMFNGLNIIDPIAWNNYYSFATKYCGAHNDRYGWNDKGATNIAELQAKISRYFLRRTKDQILLELPKKRFIEFPTQLSDEAREEYRKVMFDFRNYLKNNVGKTDKEISKTLLGEALVKLGYLRKISSKGKIKEAKELIRSIIDSDQKVVVFSCYREPLYVLKKEFGEEAVVLTGETDILERKNAVESFQKDQNIKIFLGGMKSAGVGITLTAASNVVAIDLPWVPADLTQAIDRCHRIGSTHESISIYQMFSKKTIDEKMIKLLNQKQQVFDSLIDGKVAVKGKSIIRKLLKMIEDEICPACGEEKYKTKELCNNCLMIRESELINNKFYERSYSN